MNRSTITLAAALTLVGLLAYATTAQGKPAAKPVPAFKDAPIADVLTWAQKSIGAGFVYDAADLNDPATGKPRRITTESLDPQTDAERRLLLFEILRRVNLVAFEVEGLPGPTYQLVRGEEARRFAPFVQDAADLRRYFYVSFPLRIARADLAKVAREVAGALTPASGHVETFESTHTLIVTDYSDRVRAAVACAQAADTAALRDEDLVLENFAPRQGSAKRFASALERLRAGGEAWQLTVHESSNTLLFSGRRDEIERVRARAARLDGNEANPAYVEDSFVLRVVNVAADDAARVLRDMFSAEIAAYSVQIGAYEKARSVVFRGSKADFERASATLKVIDVAPEKK